MPLISVCIPVYNRAAVLSELLESVLTQEYRDFGIVICEDKSPERPQIRKIVHEFESRYPGRIHYHENERNLGYDGNLRRMIEHADGDYCLFMGNDDLMCPGAMTIIADALKRHPETGVVMRTYATFRGDPLQPNEVFRYFSEERSFPSSARTIVTFFRRMVVLPGIVLHRVSALKFSSDRFDGTLLYQLWLTGCILSERDGLFLPQITVLYREGGTPDFGNSPSERGKFVPRAQTPASSLQFMSGMLQIAQDVENFTGLPVYKPILMDLANYSYPAIAIQRKQPTISYLRYCVGLARLGFGRYPIFYIYVASLLLLGETRLQRLIRYLKRRLGYTPQLGRLYQGR